MSSKPEFGLKFFYGTCGIFVFSLLSATGSLASESGSGPSATGHRVELYTGMAPKRPL